MMNYFDWAEITIAPEINWHQGAIEWTARLRTMIIDEHDEEIYKTYGLYSVTNDYYEWTNRYGWIPEGRSLNAPARFGSKESASTFATNAFNDLVDLCKQYDEVEFQHIYPLG